MRPALIMVFALALIFSVGAEPDARVKKFLGTSWLSIIAEADEVVGYKVKGRKGPGKQKIGGFPVIKKGPALNKAQRARLRAVIFRKSTYDFDSVKKCVFTPGHAFIFKKGGRTLNLLVCLECNEWVFQVGSETKREDFDGAEKHMKLLKYQLFLGRDKR